MFITCEWSLVAHAEDGVEHVEDAVLRRARAAHARHETNALRKQEEIRNVSMGHKQLKKYLSIFINWRKSYHAQKAAVTLCKV